MADLELQQSLLDILYECEQAGIKLILGGGFGLFIKQTSIEKEVQTVLSPENWPSPRSTRDMDLFLNTEVVTDAANMKTFRSILDKLGYKPLTEHWQFVKNAGNKDEVLIDLLTGRLEGPQREMVKISLPRVRPKGKGVGLHAHYTSEAINFDEDMQEIVIHGKLSSGNDFSGLIRLPNSFNYLVMKLHALYDRIDDEKKELGRHHALDIYRIVAMMARDEFQKTQELFKEFKEDEACKHASFVVKSFFAQRDSIGNLKLREHVLFQDSFNLDAFEDALRDLTSTIQPQESAQLKYAREQRKEHLTMRKVSLSKLKQLLLDFHHKTISPAEALTKALPLLKNKVTDLEFQWLIGEQDGCVIAEGDEGFENGLPAHIKEYRLVYPDGLVLRQHNGTNHNVKGWPQDENRLQLIKQSLSDIETHLSEQDDDYIFPPCILKVPSQPPGFQVRLVVHKSQLRRIQECFRFEFIKVVGRVVIEDEKNEKT